MDDTPITYHAGRQDQEIRDPAIRGQWIKRRFRAKLVRALCICADGMSLLGLSRLPSASPLLLESAPS